MKPGDALVDGKWVTAVVDTRCGQACYVYPDREWRWAGDLEPTGGSVVAVDKSTLPKRKQELARFLFQETDMWPTEVAQAVGGHVNWVRILGRSMGKKFRATTGSPERKKRPYHLGHWWYGRKDDDGNLQRQDQAG